MNIAYYTTPYLALARWAKSCGQKASALITKALSHFDSRLQFAPLRPLRQRLEQIQITNPKLAKVLCKMIPAQCPFERIIKFRGRVLLLIPPLCKLNPLYEEVVGLRFRALCYLADECGEDITPYLQA